jgi:cytochrome c oxidase subunit 2
MRPRSDSRRGARVAVLLAAALLVVTCCLVLAGAAWGDAFSPEDGPTRNAQDIDELYWILFGLGAAVVALVWGLMFYSVVKFRARRGVTPPEVRGNSGLELSWTLGAFGLTLLIALITLIFLPGIKNPQSSGRASVAEAARYTATTSQPPPKGPAVRIRVAGQQYIWRYQYPNGAVSFENMVVPKDVTVILTITANDVAHSWWIPKLGGKFDAIPGLTNKTWFKATDTGTFKGRCAEFCGDGHAAMLNSVTVLPLPQYLDWAARQKALIARSQKLVQVQRKAIQAAATATSVPGSRTGAK